MVKRKYVGGRPPKKPSEKQSQKTTVTLTPAEHAALRALAGREPVGSFVRRLVLARLDRAKRGGGS